MLFFGNQNHNRLLDERTHFADLGKLKLFQSMTFLLYFLTKQQPS